ncbi:aspartate kinase [Flavobacteriaceae bacterium]|jgi:aspartate kinase|nr:aspartate kinase [Flavobacteriaceae bacterium]MDA7566655.1 aspartate kinase [Flavobacteriaceae bacterium]MDA8559213.1 aspartate kinase [Flavobacteriaceae bacterium]MDA9177033.1 aspartate kinase [Flavobacteriaceae bacterium]MDB2427033.1 aspartate kinase [Flavobacteriaceae bacterium]|tara:strand:+ start:1171 stop:2421 length:1251 start_codon:yes stop_codon:yes gene_type:complete
MRIYKFGGASVKDANGVKNLITILNTLGSEKTLIVVSAMGKTTNSLELVVKNYFDNKEELQYSINEVFTFHNKILNDLFNDNKHKIFSDVKEILENLRIFLKRNKSPDYSFVYDQVVIFGEILSTKIINSYLIHSNIRCNWLDARTLIKTDSKYRDANLNWEITKNSISNGVNTKLLNITQGFIASDSNNFSTTLGREGSDYTAAIFAYCLNAESVTIWKDVPGVLNADPRVFKKPQLLNKISYTEAIELAFYGASVIHPKTLQPLQKKEIPLYVKSFLNPSGNGTAISRGTKIDPLIPCFIVQRNLNLLKLSSLDFSFIVEDNISDIFQILHENKMKVDLIQNSAISFSVCVYDKYSRLKELLSILKATFKVECTENVSLFTIRHFNENSSDEILKNNKLLLEQRTNETLQLVVS